MLKTNELIAELISLPVDMRAMLANKLLESLNATQADIDGLWADIAERRAEEVQSGEIEAIPGEEVFAQIRNRRQA